MSVIVSVAVNQPDSFDRELLFSAVPRIGERVELPTDEIEGPLWVYMIIHFPQKPEDVEFAQDPIARIFLTNVASR